MSQTRLDELYAVLEIPRNADEATIKKSYRRLVLKYHPDKNPDDLVIAQQKMCALNDAYETLCNHARRAAYEAQAVAMETKSRGVPIEMSTEAHRRVDVLLPRAFMMCPMGHPDKFLRVVDRSVAFHSREDVKHVGFDEFFAASKFGVSWLPERNNPDRLPKFGCICRVMIQPAFAPAIVETTRTRRRNADSGAGWLSFGLAEGVTSSDVMLTNVENALCSDVTLVPSPDFRGAYRFEAAYFQGCFLNLDPPSRIQMGVKDHFNVIDFMLIDFAQSSQFQKLDEVLIPVVKGIGGDRAFVKLTTVCQDMRVRSWFQMTMGNHIWDFTDFEIYFHAHWETWDYDPGKQNLRLRGPQEMAALSLKRARTPDEVTAFLNGSVGQGLQALPLDVIEHALLVFLFPNKSIGVVKAQASGCGPESAKFALTKLLTMLRDMCSSGQEMALTRLIPLYAKLANVDAHVVKPEISKLWDETLASARRRVSSWLLESDDSSFAFEILGPLLSIPLDWKTCGPVLAQKAQKLIAMKPLEELVPLIRNAASANAGSFGECLATSAMMKTFGAAPAVSVEALDAMVSGGFGLEGVGMTLRMVLPRAPAESCARVVAGLIEHSAKGADLEACWETISANGSLEALPAATLVRLAVATVKSAAVHCSKLDAICKAAQTGLAAATWQQDDRSKLLEAVSKMTGSESCSKECASLLEVLRQGQRGSERPRSRSRGR